MYINLKNIEKCVTIYNNRKGSEKLIMYDKIAKLYDDLAQQGDIARNYRKLSRPIADKVRKSDAVATVMDVAAAASGLAGLVATYLTVSTDDFHTMVLKDGFNYLSSPEGLTGLAWGLGLMGAAFAVGFVSSKVKEYRDGKQDELDEYRDQIALSHETSREIMGEIEQAEAHAAYTENFWKNYEEIVRDLDAKPSAPALPSGQDDYNFDLITDHFKKPDSKDFLTLLPRANEQPVDDDLYQQ